MGLATDLDSDPCLELPPEVYEKYSLLVLVPYQFLFSCPPRIGLGHNPYLNVFFGGGH